MDESSLERSPDFSHPDLALAGSGTEHREGIRGVTPQPVVSQGLEGRCSSDVYDVKYWQILITDKSVMDGGVYIGFSPYQ